MCAYLGKLSYLVEADKKSFSFEMPLEFPVANCRQYLGGIELPRARVRKKPGYPGTYQETGSLEPQPIGNNSGQ